MKITGFETLSDGRTVLKARVRAVPQDGEANAGACPIAREGAVHIRQRGADRGRRERPFEDLAPSRRR